MLYQIKLKIMTTTDETKRREREQWWVEASACMLHFIQYNVILQRHMDRSHHEACQTTQVLCQSHVALSLAAACLQHQ